MAVFYPSLNEIINDKMEPPTNGEWTLLQQLKALNNEYEIYFQPHIQIAHPDIIILRKGSGVLIIEVKDWNLDKYEFIPSKYDKFNSLGSMQIKNNNRFFITTPFTQVKNYKDILFECIPDLYIEKVIDSQMYGIIKTAVFFSNSTEKDVKAKFGTEDFENDNKYKRFYQTWAKDSNSIIQNIESILKNNLRFTEEIYKQVKSILVLSEERQEQSKSFSLSKEQAKYVISEEDKKQKIKGVAGSGKTLILAQRAINCFNRTKKPVLILTFNITLPNYIRDKISQLTRDSNLSKQRNKVFHITHIYSFVKQMLEEYNLKCRYSENPSIWIKNAIELLTKAKEDIKYSKYQTILADEVQDFEYSWLRMLIDLFLNDNGEFVLFGDEKQNIYSRDLDENRLPRTPIIKGRWVELKENYRLSDKNIELALSFQKEFFSNKYKIDDYQKNNNLSDKNVNVLLNKREEQRYYYINNDDSLHKICEIINNFRKDGMTTSFNDICVLSYNHEWLREIAYYLQKYKKIQTQTITETKEKYNELELAYRKVNYYNTFKDELEKIRRLKKQVFYMNPGVMKLCTIHSFKGWEINTIVLLIDSNMNEETEDELVYTAITRAKNNLVVINIGNERYNEFFEKHIKRYYYND